MKINYYLKYYTFYLETKFLSYPLVVQITLLMIVLLFIMSAYSLSKFFFLAIYHRVKAQQREKIKSKVKKQLSEIIHVEQVLSKTEIIEKSKDTIDLIKTRQDKIILTELIVEKLQKRRGKRKFVNQENMDVLVHVCMIQEFLETELLSRSVRKRREAFRHLVNLGIGCGKALVMRSTYHKNKNLRKYARAATLHYNTSEPFRFLENSFDTSFNALDEVLIHHFLINRSVSGELPLLTTWIKNSENENFKIFLVRQIGLFKQDAAGAFLHNMLNKKCGNQLKAVIVETLGILEYKEAEPDLLALYHMVNQKVQKAIIEALVVFQSPRGMEFLSSVYHSTHDYEVKIKIAYGLQQFGKQGKELLISLTAGADAFEEKIFEQVTFHYEAYTN